MKAFFTPLAEPLGALWLMMALATAGLLWKRMWRLALCLGIPVAVFFLLAGTPLVEIIVAAQERPWAANPLSPDAPADAVLALGGGERLSRHDPLGFAAYNGASRLLTAIELVRSGRAKALILGGSYPSPDNPRLPSLLVVQDWVTRSQLTNCVVTNLGICLTTHDEAIAFKKLNDSQGWHKVILVTSALHMRRSQALFHKLGIEVLPVAADFEAYGVPREPSFSPFPRQRRLDLLGLYLHEKIGWWLYRARGWV